MSNELSPATQTNAAGSRTPAVEGVVDGVCPVLETPFLANGEVDYDGFVNVVDHVVAAGVRSAMFPGFASEYLKLDETERDHLTALLIQRTQAVSGFLPVVSLADHSVQVGERRALQAVELGAKCINVLPPHLLSPSSTAVREHILRIAHTVAPVPVIIQYAPAQTGTALTAPTLANLAAEAPNIRQVKVESSPPGTLISSLEQQQPQLSAVVGYGGVQLIDALRRGAVGVQPGCSFVELYLRVWRMWSEGESDLAIDLHGRMLPYLSYWMQGVELIVAAEKRISRLRGLISTDICRAPSHQLDNEEQCMIDRFLDEFAELLPDAPSGGPSGFDVTE